MTVVRRERARWRRAVAPALLALATGAAALVPVAAAHGDADDKQTSLVLVTFDRPGTAGYRGPLVDGLYRAELARQQDATLSAVAAAEPVYRWTTALSGVAVELTDDQVTALRGRSEVAAVEENTVRPLAATGPAAPAWSPRARPGRDGGGVVIGVVDTGIWPESPLFADSPALGSRPHRFAGSCGRAEDWPAGTCNAKLVTAQWYVAGFGEGRIASDEPLSARDVRGHGTQMASIAAGNADVTIGAPGLRGDYGGVAPRAAVAAYKACWSAPDPADDGCATADLVAAIDRATRDGVDVLNLSVGGAPGIDTVERALLGAAEAGTVVVAAAGNDPTGYATHVSPWVTTVGGLTERIHTGEVVLGSGRRLAGVMTARTHVRARIVTGRSIPAPGRPPREAAVCVPGSLDASRAAGRVVVCERGVIGRTAKSAAVERADGAGMVLVNVHPGAPTHDLHAVPTVHLDRDSGRALTRWVAGHPRDVVALSPTRTGGGPARVARWSPGGDPTGSFLKPDLVAAGTGVLGSVPPTTADSRWALVSGTSAAAAWTSGAAAALLSRHDWSAPVVRSALAGSSRAVGASALASGAGAARLGAAQHTRLAHDVAPGDYRAWLDGERGHLNSPSALFRGPGTQHRRLTNVGGRTDTWRVSVEGFERHTVTVSPTSVTLRPGGSAAYHIRVSGGSVVGGLDDGTVTWVAADGSRVRVPVAIGR